jgi:hypothetical protein
VDLDGPLWIQTGRCGSRRAIVDLDGPLWIQMGRCGSRRAVVDLDGPLWIQMGRCGSRRAVVDLDGALWNFPPLLLIKKVLECSGRVELAAHLSGADPLHG